MARMRSTRRRRVRRKRSRRSPRAHAVKVDLQVFQLSKTGTSLHLEVSARGEKIGDLTIGRGSVIWRGGKRKKDKRLRWSRFAEMMDRMSYED